MPKQKTNKSAAKRFKVTGTGKILRRHASGRHLLSSKSSKRKRKIKRANLVHSGDYSNVSRMLPNG